MDVHLLHLLTCRLEILARIEVLRMLSKMLTDGSGHCKTAVRVDVDLAYCALRCLSELLLRDTYCIRKASAVCVDDINILLWN